MLIFRYVVRETFKAQMAIFLVLMTIFLSQQFISILSQASDGQLPTQLILLVLGLQLPSLAALILPISLFLGILLSQSRMYADNEMSVLHACGVSEWYITRVTLALAGMIALATAVLTLWLGPLALHQEHHVAEKARTEAGFSAVQPGRFQQVANQKAVIFIEEVSGDELLSHVFLAQMPTQHDENEAQEVASIVVAKQGRVRASHLGGQTLILEEGRRYTQNIDTLEHQVMSFDSYQMQIKASSPTETQIKLEAAPLAELWTQSEAAAQAELQWRLAIPLAIPLLAMIAVPLSRVNPRQGKFGKMGPAIVLYLGYFMILMATKRAIAAERLPDYVGLWWVHLALLGVGVFLLLKDRPMGIRVWHKIKGLS